MRDTSNELEELDKELNRAFEQCICAYQERVQASGTIQATDYEQGTEAGNATFTGRSCVVQPSISDFICDIEIAARRSLTTVELWYFNKYYKSCVVLVEEGNTEPLKNHIQSMPEKYRKAVAIVDGRMRAKMGARLIDVGIWPVEAYLAPEDVYGRLDRQGNVICIQAAAEQGNILPWPTDETFDIMACAADDTAFEPLLGAKEAAKLLCVHEKTVQAMARSGEIPCLRFGKYWRFRASVLDAWVRDRLTSDHQSRCAS